jgi:uncharacterized membrane protein YfcA
MNHFVSLLILSVVVTSVFTAISHEAEKRRLRYFLIMFAWMVVGSLAAAWIMDFIPW